MSSYKALSLKEINIFLKLPCLFSFFNHGNHAVYITYDTRLTHDFNLAYINRSEWGTSIFTSRSKPRVSQVYKHHPLCHHVDCNIHHRCRTPGQSVVVIHQVFGVIQRVNDLCNVGVYWETRCIPISLKKFIL